MLESFGARRRRGFCTPKRKHFYFENNLISLRLVITARDKTGGERCESMRAYFLVPRIYWFQMSLFSSKHTSIPSFSLHSKQKKKERTKLNSETDSTIEDPALVLGQGAS
ncbi:hypothetical protein NC651_033695 [Populus alba x Populus x berolinensis]|nr:hypothetical protein NC651_033695 [Populus alba x Populus x berolinensis]